MQRKVAASLLLAVLAVGAVACGSGSKPLTTAQFRTQASAVCRRVVTQIHAIEASATQATMHASLRSAGAAMSKGLEQLEALVPPKALADRYAVFKTWKGAQRDAAVTLSTPGGRLSARERRAVEAHHSPAFTLAQQLGIANCS